LLLDGRNIEGKPREEIEMSDILMVLATILTGIATAMIAIFTKTNLTLTKNTLELTKATHDLNKTIKESSDRYQEDMKKLQIALAAAQLYGATNPPGKSLKTQTLEDFKKIIAGGL
jgi:hypothetical protein